MRMQEIKYTWGGRAYLTHYGRRIYLDEVMKFNTPEVYGGITFHGYKTISNAGAFWVHISDCGDGGGVVSR